MGDGLLGMRYGMGVGEGGDAGLKKQTDEGKRRGGLLATTDKAGWLAACTRCLLLLAGLGGLQ